MFNKIGNKILGGLAALLLSQSVLAQETLIFVRHGEKPANDSGQLTCKGLNRALALPDVLLDRYGKPDFIFAAGPKENKTGSSLRALSTIMPTAVRVGLPIGIQFHADDIAGLQQELLSDKYQNSRIFIAWEHSEEHRCRARRRRQFGSRMARQRLRQHFCGHAGSGQGFVPART